MTRPGALRLIPGCVSVQQPGQVVAPLSRPHGITGTHLSPLREGYKMHAIEEVVSRLIAAGMDPAAAASLVACAVIEGASKKRSSGAERAARYRERKAAETVTNRDAVTPASSPPERDESVTKRDNVTRTNLFEEEKISTAPKASRKRTSLPSPFPLNETMRAFAASKGLDPPRIAREFEKFCDFHRSKGSLFVDWQAAWRTWVGNAVEYSRPPPRGGPGGASDFKWNGIEGVI